VSWHLLHWAETMRARKKKKRKNDVEVDGASLPQHVGSNAKVRRKKRGPSVREKADAAVTAKLSQEQRNVLIFGMYSQAQKTLEREGRERFSKKEILPLLDQIRDATGEADLTWDSVQRRVGRIREKETLTRLPGSERKSKFTPEVETKTVEVLRSFGGDVSRSHVFDVVKAEMGSPFMPAKSTFLRHLNNGNFKRKRVRYRPKLTESHMEKRVAFAKANLEDPVAKEERIVFVDEKRFEATSAGVLTMPVGDLTPRRAVQSKTNPVFVMVLVGVMKPQNSFDGVVGMHPFVERIAAGRNSKNREKGTIELKAFNVTGQTYIEAFEKSIFPQLQI
jgi:hypothetical protein